MREFVSKLVDNSECILQTDHSFLFVYDFDNFKYKELFFQELYENKKEKNVKNIIFNEEKQLIYSLIAKKQIVWRKEYIAQSSKGYCELANEILEKRTSNKISLILNEFEELSTEKQIYIIDECKSRLKNKIMYLITR